MKGLNYYSHALRQWPCWDKSSRSISGWVVQTHEHDNRTTILWMIQLSPSPIPFANDNEILLVVRLLQDARNKSCLKERKKHLTTVDACFLQRNKNIGKRIRRRTLLIELFSKGEEAEQFCKRMTRQKVVKMVHHVWCIASSFLLPTMLQTDSFFRLRRDFFQFWWSRSVTSMCILLL